MINTQYNSTYCGRRNRIINERYANRAGHVAVLILRMGWVDPRDTRSAGGIALKASFGSARAPHFSSMPLVSSRYRRRHAHNTDHNFSTTTSSERNLQTGACTLDVDHRSCRFLQPSAKTAHSVLGDGCSTIPSLVKG